MLGKVVPDSCTNVVFLFYPWMSPARLGVETYVPANGSVGRGNVALEARRLQLSGGYM